ncbi:MAG: prolyl oligopeptidase family serine peptidase [Planctomycetes bacterium]|nr:prolyl oligopeptidase family serine peptidase [Planctomycetota bacterium]
MQLRKVIPCFGSFIGIALATSALSSPAAEKPTAGRQVEQALAVKDQDKPAARYLLFLPKQYDAQADKAWPLILFLHGRGESYGPLSLVKKWGPPRLVEKNADFPYIVVSPQCPGKQRWSQPRQQQILVDLLDDIEKRYRVNKDRVYLTGLSLGGYGSWTLAAAHPERFAAVVPICGGGDPKDAERLKTLPIWVFHGDKDGAVPFSRSQQMVDAIRKAGGTRVRFTTLENYGHNCWSAAYASPNLYAWLDQQKISDRKQAAGGTPSGERRP